MRTFDVKQYDDRPNQQSFRVDDVEVSTFIAPVNQTESGGDWCEAFSIREGVLALSLGDVRGHGTSRTALMEALRGCVREAALSGVDPSAALQLANAYLYRHFDKESATAVLAYFNERQHTVAYANAGHPPPLVADRDGVAFLRLREADLPLGILPDFAPSLRTVSVAADSLFVFYTDGVTEHERDPVRGESELQAAVAVAFALPGVAASALIEERLRLAGSNPDDVAILTARTGVRRRLAAARAR